VALVTRSNLQEDILTVFLVGGAKSSLSSLEAMSRSKFSASDELIVEGGVVR